MLLYYMRGEIMLEDVLNGKNVFIFDLDGTLIDSVGIWNKVDHKLLSDLGNIEVPESVINLNRDRVVGSSNSGTPYEDYVLYLKEKYHLDKTKEELHDYRCTIMMEFLINEVKRTPYAKEVIELLKELGMIVVLATTTPRHTLETYCEENEDTKKLDIMNNFDLILTMEDVTHFKPDPEIFNKAIDQLSLKKEDVVIIEDSIVGVNAAIEAGIDCIAVKEEHSNESTEELKQSANYYIESLKEIYDIINKKVVKKG